MRSGRLIPLLLIALVAVVGDLAAPVARGEGAPLGTTRIAIANPSRIFNEMQETKALRAQLADRQKELQTKEKQLRDNIQFLVEKRSQYRPGSHDAHELRKQIDKAQAELQAWGVATKAEVERDQKEMLTSLYEKIEAAAAEVAQKNGIDLVIPDGRTDLSTLEDVPAEEVRRVLNSRNVLFGTKAVDITEQIITVLDAKYAQGVNVPPPIK